MNPDLFKVINDLWKKEIGSRNLFKLRFTLTYVISYLEEYLSHCEKRLQRIESGEDLEDDSIPEQL